MKITVIIKTGSILTGETDSNGVIELRAKMKLDEVVYLKHNTGKEYLIHVNNIDVIDR